MIVVITSWVLVLLSVFGITYSVETRSDVRLTEFELDRIRLEAVARSGLTFSKVLLTQTRTSEWDSPTAGWGNNPQLGQIQCGDGFFAVGSPPDENETGIWQPGIVDQSRRIPPALFDEETLNRLPGLSPEGVHIILEALTALGPEALPPLDTLPGLDPASQQAARRYLTRYGSSVNINTTSLVILIAVGLPESAAKKVIFHRNGADGLLGTGDDHPLQATPDQPINFEDCSFNSEEAAIASFLSSRRSLTTTSDYFRVVSRGWTPGLAGICEIRVVLYHPAQPESPTPATVIEWQQSWLP